MIDRELLDALGDATFIHGPDGTVLAVNTAAESIFRMTQTQLLLATVEDLSAAEEGYTMERVGAVVQAALTGEPSTIEWRSKRGDGTLFWSSVRLAAATLGGEVRVVATVRDIDDYKEAQARLEAARESHKMEAIGRLAGGVAHDFNNMLAAILSAGEQLLELQTEEEGRELCTLVVSASERAADLTRKLLAFAGKGRNRSAPVDMHDVIRDTITLLERSIARRVKLSTNLNAAHSIVLGDVGQLQNALLNLGINARDAMPDGGELAFSTSIEELDQAACARLPFALAPGRFLKLSVRDSGEGIPPEALDRIFEPFFTLKGPGKGTGLGLAAVHGTLVEHHAAATVHSEVGQGTEFTLWLPAAEGIEQPKEAARRQSSKRGTILLVDDEPLLLSASARLLASLGYEVITAVDGDQALVRFAESHDKLVAIVSDVAMPNLDGFQLLSRIRDQGSDIPILLTSGYPRDYESNDNRIEPDAFVSKPFRRSELAAQLDKLTASG